MKRDESSVRSVVADLAVLGKLFEEQRPRLHGMIQRRIDPVLKGRLDADDVLSETFLLAQKRWDSFKQQPNAKPYPWLYRLAVDCLIEAWRRETRECRDPRAEMPWPEESSVLVGLNLVGGGTSPTQAAARAEVRKLVLKVLDLLPKKHRDILQMRHQDDLSFADMGAVLEISENAATSRYVRALQRFRDLWHKLYAASGLSP